MNPRLPSAWTVALVAAILGLVVGSGSAALATLARPMRIGDFSGSIFGAGPVDRGGGPKAMVATAEHDFGVMGTGQSGTHRFVIGNEGTVPLSLRQGQSSCRCTIAAIEKAEIPPGESASVTIEWRTKEDAGPFRQQVAVHTNDPRRPDVSFQISGDVVPAWRAIPPAIVFPKLGTHGGDRATLTLLTYGTATAELAKLSLSDPATADFFEIHASPLPVGALASIEGGGEAKGGYTIDVTTRRGLAIGPLRQALRVEFSPGEAAQVAQQSESGPTVAEIPIEGTVAGDIAVTGRCWDSSSQAVLLGNVSSRTGLETEIFLTVKGPHREQVRPKVADAVPASLEVQIGEPKPIGSGSVLRIPLSIAIPPGSPTCNHLGNQQGALGRIVLETGHPDTAKLVIPVRVVVGP